MSDENASSALLTDLYELTMAQGYWNEGIAEREAVFHLYARSAPYGGDAMVVAGIGPALDWLEGLVMDASDLAYLSKIPSSDGTPLFAPAFLQWLGAQKMRCDVDVIAEGEVVAPPVPFIRVCGPLWQAQIVESALLNMVNFQTLIATSAARTVRAALGGAVLEFGLRRAQGVDGAMAASRAAYVGGVDATSNVLAGKRWGIPVKGTHAHAWVTAFGDELEAFRAYARLPGPTILLVDTWDTLDGVRNAIIVAREMRAQGRELAGIRLDSGDLGELAKSARKMLDAAGFESVKIVASNDLDEERVRTLLGDGAPITVWGIGTRLVTGGTDSALGGVYKLSALQDRHGHYQPLLKRSEERAKASYPGKLQVWRCTDNDGRTVDVMTDLLSNSDLTADVVTLQGDTMRVHTQNARPLLVPALRHGQRVRASASASLEPLRARALQQWERFAEQAPVPAMHRALWRLRERLLAEGPDAVDSDSMAGNVHISANQKMRSN